jgi:glycogen operon protein
MLTAGDEFGRTQRGNNNAYCQDNDISWVDWSLLEPNRELFAFTQKLIALRRDHPALRAGEFYTANDVEWLGPGNRAVNWESDSAIGMHIKGNDPLVILINNEEVDLPFELPRGDWKQVLATAPAAVPPAQGGVPVRMPAGSVSVFTA